jgi:hypothetical protein
MTADTMARTKSSHDKLAVKAREPTMAFRAKDSISTAAETREDAILLLT